MDKPEWARWLETKYIEWLTDLGEVRTQAEFADWLGIDRVRFNRYFNGKRVPADDALKQIGAKLGPEIYDLLGLERPDPRLREMRAQYDTIPSHLRPEYVERLRGFTADFLERHGYVLVESETSPDASTPAADRPASTESNNH